MGFKGMNVTQRHYGGSGNLCWDQMQECNVNLVLAGGGSSGNRCQIQANENHPYRSSVADAVYDPQWAQHLETLLATADSYDMKVAFNVMGNRYGTMLGIVAPMTSYQTVSPYSSISNATAVLDKLAGDNSLSHNFLSDSRVAWWSPINEARLDNSTVRTWTLALLQAVQARGGKTSVCVDNGVQPYYRAFPDILPIIGGDIDFVQAHDYQESSIRWCDGHPERDMYNRAYPICVNHMEYMLDTCGGFTPMLTEWGMGHQTDGQGWDSHVGDDVMTTKQQQADYIQAYFDAGLETGFKDIVYFECYWRRSYPSSREGFGFINVDGAITNQQAYDTFRVATVDYATPKFSGDAYLYATRQKGFSGDTYLYEHQTKSFGGDAELIVPPETEPSPKPFTADTLLLEEQRFKFYVNAYLLQSANASFSGNACLYVETPQQINLFGRATDRLKKVI